MQQDVLSEIVAGQIWASERPVWFSGVRLRARTSVVRLNDGRLLVHSPAPSSDVWMKQIADLGNVSWLVVPNCFHHLGTPAAADAYPEAKILAPKSAAVRNRKLRIDVDIREATSTDALPDFALLPLEGVPFLDETLLYHRPTETLFGADLVLRADENDHWSWRFAARITGCFKRVRVPPDVRKNIADKEAASRSIRVLQTLPIKRLIVCHGPVIDVAPLDQLVDAWRLVGVG
jgi:hypothetical protein